MKAVKIRFLRLEVDSFQNGLEFVAAKITICEILDCFNLLSFWYVLILFFHCCLNIPVWHSGENDSLLQRLSYLRTLFDDLFTFKIYSFSSVVLNRLIGQIALRAFGRRNGAVLFVNPYRICYTWIWSCFNPEESLGTVLGC